MGPRAPDATGGAVAGVAGEAPAEKVPAGRGQPQGDLGRRILREEEGWEGRGKVEGVGR